MILRCTRLWLLHAVRVVDVRVLRAPHLRMLRRCWNRLCGRQLHYLNLVWGSGGVPWWINTHDCLGSPSNYNANCVITYVNVAYANLSETYRLNVLLFFYHQISWRIKCCIIQMSPRLLAKILIPLLSKWTPVLSHCDAPLWFILCMHSDAVSTASNFWAARPTQCVFCCCFFCIQNVANRGWVK